MLLSTAFYLSGLILFLKSVTSDKRKGLYLAGLFLTSLMGVSSRENFATFPVVLLLYDMLFLSGLNFKKARSHWKAYVPVLLAFVYFIYIVLNHSYKKYGGYGKGIPPLDYVLTQFSVHWTYLRLMALPINQNLDYDYPLARTFFELRTLLSVAGHAGLLGLSAFYVKRKPLISFGLLWFLIALAPVSFMIALLEVSLGDVIFEHRLYLPSAGLMVLAASLLVKLSKSPSFGRAVMPAAVILSLVLGTAAYARNAVWSDGIRLWSDVIDKSPRKARGYNNASMYYREDGQAERAIEFLKKALAITPSIAESHYNLGNAYSDKGQFLKALQHYQKAIELNPNFVNAHVNLGILYNKVGQPGKAIAHYEWAVRLKPDNPNPYYNLANAYMQQGRLDEAASNYEKAIRIMPDDMGAHNNLAIVYINQGRIDEAITHYKKAISLKPDEPGIHNNLAIAYRMKGLNEKAAEHLSIAEKLRRKSKAK
jgi:tetratricopeptide (TPR) repeat protein